MRTFDEIMTNIEAIQEKTYLNSLSEAELQIYLQQKAEQNITEIPLTGSQYDEINELQTTLINETTQEEP